MTTQIGETLIVNGEQIKISALPSFPVNHPRIESVPPEWTCSALWRGYRGTWEITNGRFYLRELIGKYRLLGSKPLFADWFSGSIKTVSDVRETEQGLIYQEVHYFIQNGIVVDEHPIGIEYYGDELVEYDRLCYLCGEQTELFKAMFALGFTQSEFWIFYMPRGGTMIYIYSPRFEGKSDRNSELKIRQQLASHISDKEVYVRIIPWGSRSSRDDFLSAWRARYAGTTDIPSPRNAPKINHDE
jgi:hypothetical protein